LAGMSEKGDELQRAVGAGQDALARARHHAELVREARDLARSDKLEAADRTLAQVLRENPAHAGALALRREVRARADTEKTLPTTLAQAFRTPVTLEFRDAGLGQALEALSHYGGLNFIIDKDVPPNLQVTVFLRQVPLADALDVILSTNQLR